MDIGLTGKNVVVGGGAGGIGRVVCEMLAGYGARVEVADIKSGVDLGDPGAVRNYFADLRERYDNIYGYVSLVYSGGYAGEAGICDTTADEFERELKNTLLAALYPIQETVRWMRETGGGHIVVVSSVNSVLGLNEASYDIAKGGLNRIAPDIAVAHGKDGIYACTLLPGTVCQTDSWADEKHQAVMANVARWIPDGNVTTPEEVAESIAFLLSKHGCMFSGSTIIADRGWHLKPVFKAES